ncbi:MAG TPA: hypothetical protein VE973_00740, partial [Candidatus Limnocylindria bacterium]|nr:hypothetical protein [Candidatus Limnocylindria bacterium]
NKQTGEVLCAFDEVHEGGHGEKTGEKKLKVEKLAKRGGASVRYGLTMQAGALKRSEMKHVPVFYLSLKTERLEDLIANMQPGKPSQIEKQIFSELVTSLKTQSEELKKVSAVPEMVSKLETFTKSLEPFEEAFFAAA